MRRFAAACIALIALTVNAPATRAYLSPGAPVGFVNDFAALFPAEARASLESELASYRAESGNEVVVVTVPTLGDETAETYATALFAEWGIGAAAEDSGVLLLVARDERAMRIEVGYGLEPLITDAEVARIIRDILVPAFAEGRYADGVSAALSDLLRLLGGTGAAEAAAPNDSVPLRSFSGELLGTIAIVILNLFAIMARTRSWWLGGILGGIVGFLWFRGIAPAALGALIGLVFDFILSRFASGTGGRFWGGFGGFGGFGGGGGGFGGFGGGRSGGGGASGRW